MRQLRKHNLASLSILLLLATLIMPFTPLTAMAQATTGALKGVIADSNGAIITDATVTAKNTETGSEAKTRTNSEGLYSFPRLAPGKYLLVVEKDGFKRQEFQDVTINIGQDLTLDAALQAGQVSETVTITASGEQLIQKEQSQISNTFEARKVAELPSNVVGGGIDTLALLAPGVVPGFGNVNNNGTTLSVNGQRARSNNFTVDGQDNNDLSLGGPAFFVTNNDAVGEFQIVTNNFSAEYGRNQGAVVNIVTKAGTNSYHGTAFWAYQNQNLFDSMTNIERRTNNNGKGNPDPLLNNVYSGSFGGPIIKDKGFFFGSYQFNSVRTLATVRAVNPTIAAEELVRLRADFPNNPVVAALTDFSAFAITDFGTVSERTDFPQNETVTIGGNLYRVAYPQREFAIPNNAHELSLRGDYVVNSKHSVWYRHLYQTADGINGLGGSGGFTGNAPGTGHLTGGTLTSQISGSAVNEFRFVFTRLNAVFGGGCDGLKGCISHPDNIGDTLTNLSFVGLTSSGGTSLQAIGAATNLPQGRTVTTYQFQENFSKTIGRHQLKFGADIRRLTNSVPFLPNINGQFRFPSSASIVNNTPTAVNIAAGELEISYNETDQFYYFQNDWRVRDNLTLNLGVRYEYTGQPINTLHDLSLERESNPDTAIWRQSIPLESRIFPKLAADKNNWAPRLGFAWRPGLGGSGLRKLLLGEQDQTVIRGGYSIAYDPGFYNIMLNVSTSSPLVFLNTVPFPLPSNPTGTAIQEFAASNNIIRTNTFDPRFFSQTTVSPDFHSPYSQQWSFGFQREITRSNVIEVRYVGTHAVGLFQTTNGNPRIDRLVNGFTANVPGLGAVTFPGFPNLVPQGITPLACVNDPATPDNEAACNGRVLPQGLIRVRGNSAQSSYHGLQTQYQGRLFNQLNLGMSYTWSKSLDNASEIFSFFETSATQHPFNITNAERGYSGFDRRHAMSLNYIWDIPAFRSQSGFIGKTLGGWQVNGAYFLANGQRFTPQQFVNASVLGGFSYQDNTWELGFVGGIDSFRPFYGNPNAPRTSVGISQIDAAIIFGVPVTNRNGFYDFNALNNGQVRSIDKNNARYIFNGPGAALLFGSPFGDVGRGAEVGPRLNNFNLGIAKNTQITETIRIQFRVDMFNALNHPNPGVGFIVNNVTPNTFVEGIAAAGTNFNDRTEMQFARRSMQFGLKLIF